MSASRRDFVQQALGLALAAPAGLLAAESATPAGKPWLEGSDLVAKMNWLNAPASATYGSGVVTARTRPRTDFWRKTFYGYVTDNGHFYYIPVFGEFTFRARVIGQYATLYDQAGLMVRLDERNWMKCGTEFVDGKRRASVVFTHDFSDWSTMDDLSQKDAVYWRVVRKKDSIEAQISEDGRDYLTVRQGYFQPYVEVQVGLMCAAPEGAGFEATFDELRLDKP
jgi:regulation of enolase protein 1 (concanavalin A-like superfamily)